jgi:hypothetical protein
MTLVNTSSEEIISIPTIEQFRKETAKEIRTLIEAIESNSLRVGSLLLEVYDTFKIEGGTTSFRQWLKDEKISLNYHTAFKYMRVAKKVRSGKLEKLSMLVPFSILDELAGNNVPNEVITEIEEWADEGEVTVQEVRDFVKQHRPPKPENALPSPNEANRIAREMRADGDYHMVLASDENYYFGHTKEEAQMIENKIKVIYGVREAIDTLAGMESSGFTPEKFIEQMLPHQRWTEEEEHRLELAARWIQQLVAVWRRRN